MSDFQLVDSQGWEYDLQSVRAFKDHDFVYASLHSIGVRCIHGLFSTQCDTLASGYMVERRVIDTGCAGTGMTALGVTSSIPSKISCLSRGQSLLPQMHTREEPTLSRE